MPFFNTPHRWRPAMISAKQTNAMKSLYQLPALPHAPIFDPPYDAKLASVLNGSAFPAAMSTDEIYQAQLAVIQTILDDLTSSSWHLSIALLFAWLLMIVMGGYLLFRLRRYREQSLAGDAKVARKIVLPAFEPLLWLLVVINLVFIVIYSALLIWTDYLAHKNKITIEIIVALKQFNPLLVPVYMLQPSLSRRALIRATLQTVLLAGYTVPLVMVLRALETPANTRMCFWILMVARCPVGLYALYHMIYPPARASPRVFRLNCGYIAIMTISITAMALTFHSNKLNWSRAIGWAIAIYALLLPAHVWQLLRADTEHWRGIGMRAVELQEMFRRRNGRVDERVSSQGLHVLIEMHRKYIIDFTLLELGDAITNAVEGDTRCTASVVFRGFLHTKKIPVSVKIYLPTQFTEETVAEFSHEAALCGSLVHPNIIKFHGLCVCPPNICLVTELCAVSLQDQLAKQAICNVSSSPRRQQLLINIGLMIDAARAVAHLYSFSPPFVHGNINPSSFRIDDQGTVKLTDFGASRTSAVQSRSTDQQRENPPGDGHRHHQSAGGRRVLEMPNTTSQIVKYSAPEVLTAHQENSESWREAADVFSLGATMYEIAHNGRNVHDQLTHVVRKSRSTSRAHQSVPVQYIHPALASLIENACQSDPRRRPPAQALVAALENIQEEVGATFAHTLLGELNKDRCFVDTAMAPRTACLFAGTQAVEKMCARQFVDTQSEAIRLGSMLMDSGLLHHTKHTCTFGNSKKQFVFDDEQISLCQPLVVMDLEDDEPGRSRDHANAKLMAHVKPAPESRVKGSSDTSSALNFSRMNSHSSPVLQEQRCACRKLGQHLTSQLTTRRRFRDKFKVFSDENLLTANLLADEAHVVDFAAFQEPSGRRIRGAQARLAAGTDELV